MKFSEDLERERETLAAFFNNLKNGMSETLKKISISHSKNLN